MKKNIFAFMQMAVALLVIISCKISSESENIVYSDPVSGSFKTASFATSLTTAYCDLSWQVEEGTYSTTVCIFRDDEKIAEVTKKTTCRDTGVEPDHSYNYKFENKDGKRIGYVSTSTPVFSRYILTCSASSTSALKKIAT